MWNICFSISPLNYQYNVMNIIINIIIICYSFVYLILECICLFIYCLYFYEFESSFRVCPWFLLISALVLRDRLIICWFLGFEQAIFTVLVWNKPWKENCYPFTGSKSKSVSIHLCAKLSNFGAQINIFTAWFNKHLGCLQWAHHL